jgi:hypothetical protein
LERWRAERLWRRAAELEAASRMAPSTEAAIAAGTEGEGQPLEAPDAVELSTVMAAALESGMDPAAVERSARLELLLGCLDGSRPSGFEAWSARANGIPSPPLAAAGRSALDPSALLAAFELATSGEQYALRFLDSRPLASGGELRVYEVPANWEGSTRPFRDKLRSYASVSRLAVAAEPAEEGGSRFEIIADTRRSARVYGASLAATMPLLGISLGALGALLMPAAAFLALPLGAALGAGASLALHRAIAAWAFPAARGEIAALARSLSLRTGGQTGGQAAVR